MSKSFQTPSAIAFALIANLLSPLNALADVFNVYYDVTIDQFSQSSGVFGVNTPTQVSLHYQIDTDAAPVVFIPAGTWIPDHTIPFKEDLYGYDASAISPFSFSFGSEHFDNDDLGDRRLAGPRFVQPAHAASAGALSTRWPSPLE